MASFIVDGTVFAQAINSATKIIGKGDGSTIVIKSVKKRPGYLRIRGVNDSRYLVSDVKVDAIDGDIAFSADFDRLSSVVNKRALMEFKLSDTGGVLEYSSKHTSYKGHIATVATKPIDLPELEESSGKSMSSALRIALFDLFKFVNLSPAFVNRDMMLFVEGDKEGVIRAASSDEYHIGMIERKPDKDSEKTSYRAETICLPFNYVSLITSAFTDKQKISMASDKSYMHVFTENMRISLPLVAPPSATDTSSPTMAGIKAILAKNSAASAKKGESTIRAGFTVDIEPIKLCMDNMTGLKDSEKSDDMLLKVVGSRLSIRMESKHGSSTDGFDIVNKSVDKASLWLDPSLARDVIDRLEGNIEIRFHNNNLCLLEKTTSRLHYYYLLVAKHKKAAD
jgi:hypothetical protein